MIEVEMRGVLTPQEYASLKDTLSRDGTFVKTFTRFNLLYRDKRRLEPRDFSSKNGFDLKCRVTAKESELVVKLGNEASADREEIEVTMPKQEFTHAVDFLRALGYSSCLATLRMTERYMYDGVEFSLVKSGKLSEKVEAEDKNIYYEAEIAAEKDAALDAKRKIVAVLAKLNLKVLKEHGDDIMQAGGDPSMKSDASYYSLIDAINNTIDVFMDTKTEEGMKTIERAMKVL